MTRKELTEKLMRQHPQIPPDVICDAVDVILDAMGDALVDGHALELRTLGRFITRTLPPRVISHPKDQRMHQLPKRKVIRFKPSRALLNQLKMLDK